MGLEIRFQEKSHLESAVQITAPVTVRVDETPEGDARGLEIVDETGSRTRIRLQTVPSGDVLDGMAPGERHGNCTNSQVKTLHPSRLQGFQLTVEVTLTGPNAQPPHTQADLPIHLQGRSSSRRVRHESRWLCRLYP